MIFKDKVISGMTCREACIFMYAVETQNENISKAFSNVYGFKLVSKRNSSSEYDLLTRDSYQVSKSMMRVLGIKEEEYSYKRLCNEEHLNNQYFMCKIDVFYAKWLNRFYRKEHKIHRVLVGFSDGNYYIHDYLFNVYEYVINIYDLQIDELFLRITKIIQEEKEEISCYDLFQSSVNYIVENQMIEDVRKFMKDLPRLLKNQINFNDESLIDMGLLKNINYYLSSRIMYYMFLQELKRKEEFNFDISKIIYNIEEIIHNVSLVKIYVIKCKYSGNLSDKNLKKLSSFLAVLVKLEESNLYLVKRIVFKYIKG